MLPQHLRWFYYTISTISGLILVRNRGTVLLRATNLMAYTPYPMFMLPSWFPSRAFCAHAQSAFDLNFLALKE